jgi:sulfatase maturation enzyme AslB (radical SAM superfamily)
MNNTLNTFCSLPWVGLDVSPQGSFKPCCKYSNTLASNIDDYFASTELESVKQDFLAGKRPEGCARCWRDEDAGLESKRQLDFKYTFGSVAPELDGLKVISMPFGNTCNLACRICSSSASSRWYTEALRLRDKIPEIVVRDHKKFYKDQTFMTEIVSRTNNPVLFEFPGGEPFLTGKKEHLSFLRDLSKTDASNLKLHYVTNTTIMPDTEFWDIWKLFKNVDLQLSIDGIGSHFEYNRWPADWTQSYKHIKEYQRLQQQYSNIQLSISHTVSIFTVYYLPEFISWCESEGLPDPYLGLLTEPLHYSTKSLPLPVAMAISERLTLPKLEKIARDLLDNNSNDFDKFANYVTIIDDDRKQNFSSTFPELYQLLKEYFNA